MIFSQRRLQLCPAAGRYFSWLGRKNFRSLISGHLSYMILFNESIIGDRLMWTGW